MNGVWVGSSAGYCTNTIGNAGGFRFREIEREGGRLRQRGEVDRAHLMARDRHNGRRHHRHEGLQPRRR